MPQKTFGPVRGAGTQITEIEGDKPITPGALGQVGYAGLFEKGMVGVLTLLPTKKAFLKKMGNIYADTMAPDAAIDFFDVADGAGALWAVRVTDGNELAAEVEIIARRGLRTVVGKVKAKNGGRWGGKERLFTALAAAAGNYTETTLTTAVATFKVDEWKGGFVELEGAAGKRYEIIGNTAAGVVTVKSDARMRSDLGTSPTSLRYFLVLENVGKQVSIQLRDGDVQPDAEFSLDVFVDDVLVNSYARLSNDVNSPFYFPRVINDDDGNDEIEVSDLFSGTLVANVRPTNGYGLTTSVTPTVLTAVIHDVTNNSPTLGNATFALGATTDVMVEQKITLTFTSPTAFTIVSDRFGAFPAAGALGVAVASPNKWIPGFTGTAGATPMVAGDTIVVNYKPFVPKGLLSANTTTFLYPDKVNAPRERYRIVDNTHKTITVADGSDLTISGAAADEFMVVFPQRLRGGRDGHSAVNDASYVKALETTSSPFRGLRDRGLGLVKLAAPGVTSVAVQKQGIALATSLNLQWRVEIPANIVTEISAQNFTDTQVGRSDYAVVSFPSYGYVLDPDPSRRAGLKLTTLTGQIHGRESRMAVNNDGYHKASAGLEATLPKVLKLATDNILDEEMLNPLGINVIKRLKGNFVLWGDRTLSTDPAWQFKHQREQMSHYEKSLSEAFDYIIFAINDPLTQSLLVSSLRTLFLPEFQKRALRGTSFEDACFIKVDNENNTDATRAAGDMFADILLRLADTVERLRIRIGKQGLFTAAT